MLQTEVSTAMVKMLKENLHTHSSCLEEQSIAGVIKTSQSSGSRLKIALE